MSGVTALMSYDLPLPRPGTFGKLLALAAVALDVDTDSFMVWFPPQKPPAGLGPIISVLYSRGSVEGVKDKPSLGIRGCRGVLGVYFLC